MVRRGSVSSIGSNTGSIRQAFGGRPNLQRRGSSASMTERTFRAPSPGPRTFAPNSIPNVPGLVAAATTNSTPLRKRASSVEPGPRVLSPEPPRTTNFRGVSADRGNALTKRPARANSLAPLAERSEEHHMADQIGQLPPGARATAAIGAPKTRRTGNQASAATARQAQSAVAPKMTRKTSEGNPLPNGTTENNGMMPSATQAAGLAAVSIVPAATTSAKRMTSIAPPAARPASQQAMRPASQQAMRPASQASNRPASRLASNGFPSEAAKPQPPIAGRPVATRLGSDGFAMQSAAAAAGRQANTRPTMQQTATPSQEQIKTFQNRASAMLARPRSPDAVVQPTLVNRQRAATDVNGDDRPSSSGSRQNKSPNTRAVSQPVSFLAPSGPNRTGSVSPARSARFSETPVALNVHHDPPSSVLSPVKSALKGHNDRPITPSGSSRPPNFSDSRSENGSASNAQKKGVRVSFGQAPPLPANGTATITHQQAGTEAASGYRSLLNETEEGMSPRPALPTFGSVRSRKDHVATSGISAMTTTASEPAVSSSGFTSGTLHIPAGPSFTTMTQVPSATSSTPAFDFTRGTARQERDNDVSGPSIAVQPASPGTNNSAHGADLAADMDRAFAINDSARNVTTQSSHMNFASGQTLPVSETNRILAALSDDSSEGVQGSLPPVHDWQYNGQVEHELNGGSLAVSADSQDSTAEEETDVAGGFTSLNAIMESPTVEGDTHGPAHSLTTQMVHHTEPVGIPVEPQTSTSEEDWDRVRLYWSSLSEQKKQEFEQEALVPGSENSAARDARNMQLAPQMHQGASQPVTPKKTKKKVQTGGPVVVAAAAAAGAAAPLPPWPDQQYQQTSRTAGALKQQAPLKSSMRGSRERASSEAALGNKPAGGSMRSSMRNSSDSHTMDIRGAPPPQRVSSLGSPQQQQQPRGKMMAGLPTSAPAAKAKPQLSRVASNSSDGSESSFKKRRRGNSSASMDGRYNMKKTMRSSSVPPQAAYQPGQTMSPPPMRPGSRFSLRAPSPSPSLLNKGLRPGKTRTNSGKGNDFQSRFDNSSDEEDEGGLSRPFQSRLAPDSDDEDEPITTTPAAKKMFGGFGGRSTSKQVEHADGDVPGVIDEEPTDGALLTAERTDTTAEVAPTSPVQKPARGFFGLGKKKEADAATSATIGAEPMSPASPARSTRGRDFMRRFSASPSRQAAPPIDRSVPVPAIPEEYQPSSPALAHAGTPTTAATVTGASNGVVATDQTARPALLGTKTEKPASRMQPQRPPIVSRRSGKEKRFQGLRRVFGLND